PDGPPPTPTGLTADASSGDVVLTWSDGPGETAYRLRRALAPLGETQGSYSNFPVQPANTTQLIDAEVAEGTRYRYQVRACNSVGCSSFASVYVTTPEPADPPEFDIELVFVNTPTATELAAFEAAEARW